MYDIVSLGEILIDLTQCGINAQGVVQLAANPGGAPANMAVAAARLGCRTAFIGKVGKDAFGDSLRKTLQENGVDTTAMQVDPVQPTTLAVVTLDAAGERSFSFYRNPGADTMLRAEEVPQAILESTKFFHFGSVSLTADPERTATLDAVHRAKKAGALITFDPNYRANLWPDAKNAVAQIQAALPLADILKVSDEEMTLLTGCTDPQEGSLRLMALGIPLVLITLGADGACYRMGDCYGKVNGFAVKVADTNGAGDTFLGAFLSRIKERESLSELDDAKLREAVTFANKAASLTTSRPGAIPAMPTLQEVSAGE